MLANSGDFWKPGSVDDLLAMAAAMAGEAADGYAALSMRMSAVGRNDLAVVFDALVAEERETPGAERASTRRPEKIFDDEGTGRAAPELLTAYRVFSMAVRNAERAFSFWSYVSAHARSRDIRAAAERMAREKLSHAAACRGERRKAFHQERDDTLTMYGSNLSTLEERLSRCLLSVAHPGASADEKHGLELLAKQADLRAKSMLAKPFDGTRHLARATHSVMESPLSLCELLADCYLHVGDRATTEGDADRARDFAAQVLSCLRTLHLET